MKRIDNTLFISILARKETKMKRIETIEDVKKAMEISDEFRKYMNKIMADDWSETINMSINYAKEVFEDFKKWETTLHELEVAMDALGPLSDDDIIEHEIDSDFYLDDLKFFYDDKDVYLIRECYADRDDITFLMRYEIEENPLHIIGLCNYYFGEPNDEFTADFLEVR